MPGPGFRESGPGLLLRQRDCRSGARPLDGPNAQVDRDRLAQKTIAGKSSGEKEGPLFRGKYVRNGRPDRILYDFRPLAGA